MKYSPFVLALFSLVTLLTLPSHAMTHDEPASVEWLESNDVYTNISSIRCSSRGSYQGINGLIEITKKRDLRTGKQLQLSGILYPKNTAALSLPYMLTTTIFDQLSFLHYQDLRNQEAQRVAKEKSEAKKLALDALSEGNKTAWQHAY